MNRGPVDYESTALPTELPRLRIIHSSIARKKLSNAGIQADTRSGYRESGYISQPIPTAISRNAKNAHRIYFTRSEALFFERNANVTDTATAKNNKA